MPQTSSDARRMNSSSLAGADGRTPSRFQLATRCRSISVAAFSHPSVGRGPPFRRFAGVGRKHVVELGDLQVMVGDDRIIDLVAGDILDVLQPALVRTHRIDRQADHLGVALGKLILEAGERIAQLSPIQSWKRIGPWVVSAVKSGATLPIESVMKGSFTESVDGAAYTPAGTGTKSGSTNIGRSSQGGGSRPLERRNSGLNSRD